MPDIASNYGESELLKTNFKPDEPTTPSPVLPANASKPSLDEGAIIEHNLEFPTFSQSADRDNRYSAP